PQTIDQLRTWIKAHPGKFEYARPRNSGPGRTMLMGLPYLLKDSDPKDPAHGWTKTWSFLKDIGSSIDYYPARTGVTMTELGNDTRWMIATTMGWDINPRALGQVPQGFKTFMLQGTSFVADDLFMMMPKGLDAQHKAVILDMISYALQPKQQAYIYDKGYFYPGPAIKNVPVTMAPASSQTALQTFGRPEYDQLATSVPIMLPLSADNLNTAFDMWDHDIGGSKVKS
ncbi:MAG: extracellular solute-binding protein, partial [Ktedonobacteraceae bacterium]